MSKRINNALKCIPVYLWLIIFTVVPLLMVFFYAIFEVQDDGSIRFTLEYLNDAVTNGQYLDAMLRSLEYALISTIVCLVLGYPLAYILANMEERKRNFISVLFLLPMWMNFLIRTYALSSLINEQGIITRFLQWMGLINGSITGTEAAIVIGMVYNFLPFMILPLYSVMAKMDNRVIEAAQDLGSNYWQVLRRVILPLSAPGIVSGVTMVFVPAVSTFVISKLLGGSKNMMIGDVIESMFMGDGSNYNAGAALSLLLMVLMLLCMSLMRRVDSGEDDLGGMMA